MPRRLTLSILCSLNILILTVACNDYLEDTVPTIASTVSADVAIRTSSPTPPPSVAAPPSATPPPTVTPAPSATIRPTATPSQLMLVAVPPFWESRVAAAIDSLPPQWSWQATITTDPQALLERGSVHAALLPDNQGVPAGQRPLVIAAPFASAWLDISLEEARQIQQSGHDTLSILPWHELAASQRALTVDGSFVWDAAYPLQQSWSLHTTEELAPATVALGEQLQLSAPSEVVKLAAVGDVMLDRALGEVIAAGDVMFPFAFVAETLQSADYAIANLECAVGDAGEPAAKSYTFRAPPAAAQSIALAGFDLVSMANNHALDYGPLALRQGMALLEEQGVSTVGAGEDGDRAHRPHVVTLKGIRIAFLAYVNVPVEGRAPYFDSASWTAGPQSPGLAWANPEVIAADVGNVKEEVDHVVVILHSGYEYVPAPSPEQIAASQTAIDAGATLVIGHHAHILQGVEFRGDGAIVYGLGNFAFNIDGPPETTILNIWLDRQGLRQLRFLPATIQASGQPRMLVGDDAASVRRRIYTLSSYLN